MMEVKYNLQERLLDFASLIIDISEILPPTYAGIHLSKQILRSGTSPALHYGEAQAAESPQDFIHKMKVCLKELRESFNCLKLISRKKWVKDEFQSRLIVECNELIAIYVTSIKTAQLNLSKTPKKSTRPKTHNG